MGTGHCVSFTSENTHITATIVANILNVCKVKGIAKSIPSSALPARSATHHVTCGFYPLDTHDSFPGRQNAAHPSQSTVWHCRPRVGAKGTSQPSGLEQSRTFLAQTSEVPGKLG